jgi:hypothetical protein
MSGRASSEFRLPVADVLRRLNRKTEVYRIRDLVLDRWDLFESTLLLSGFAGVLAIKHPQNQKQATEVIREILEGTVKLSDLHKKEAFDLVIEQIQEARYLNRIYSNRAKREDVLRQIREADLTRLRNNYWTPVAELFRDDRPGARKVESILFRLFKPGSGSRPLVIIDLSPEQAGGASTDPSSDPSLFNRTIDNAKEDPARLWNDKVQALVIKRLLEGVLLAAEMAYKENRGLNTLVLIDEAHRLAPREEPSTDELKAIRAILTDAARTTRKQGVGWVFISQTLSSLYREIVGQLRIFFFGFGLSMGTEFRALSELVGGRGKALDLYRLFRDPHSSFDVASREYSFMTTGPVSPLSFAGTPLFFNAFTDPDEFLKHNRLTATSRSEQSS